ncbi:hypothetical protein, partial [Methanohalophilus sp. WG1-DM]|uniref:hypothetical protein n=1 Tax=Methanohalophilus sp. WG1-DM TaxID=2491675 RepID=UPI0019D4A76C
LQVYPGISGVLVSHPDECLIDIQAPCRKGGVVDILVYKCKPQQKGKRCPADSINVEQFSGYRDEIELQYYDHQSK